MTVSLLKPAKALSGGSRPVATTASMTPRAMTSAGIRSHANGRMATPSIVRQMAMSGVILASLAGVRAAIGSHMPDFAKG
jgi:hypothetical protein